MSKEKDIKDPFDPSNLRLNQDFAENLGARKEIVIVPVRKPGSQEFFRVIEDKEMRITVSILEWQADRESYLVSPDIRDLVGKDAKPRYLIPSITANEDFFLWPLKITSPGDRENTWNTSSYAAAEKAEKQWVNMSSNLAAQAYDVRIAEGNIAEPKWPTIALKDILRLAFKDRFIQDLDHPIIKKLKGYP